MKKQIFNVQGMTCSACVSHVTNAVKALNGVKNVNVSLLTNSMDVTFDENVTSNSDIILAVDKAGYKAYENNKIEENINNKKQDETKKMKTRVILSFVFLVCLMYLSMGEMMHHYVKIPVLPHIPSIITQFILTCIIVVLNKSYYINGFKRLLKLKPNMDSLIAIGSGTSLIYSIYGMFVIIAGTYYGNAELVHKYAHSIYFESCATILTLVTLGKYLETKSKNRTTELIDKLVRLRPDVALVIKNGKACEIKIEDIKENDIIEIKPGMSIPVDGVVVEGETFIDESTITGESLPKLKKIGDTVISGTINKNGYIKFRATKVGSDTTISKVIEIVNEASNSKAPISRLADRVSGIFVPVVIIISIVTFLVWIITSNNIETSLTMMVSVLVISCPCALGLATPVAIMVGTGVAAKNGILLKSAETFEKLEKIDTVIFDKTGTITKGKLEVTNVISNINEKELLSIAGGLENMSEHPIKEAVLKEVTKQDVNIKEVTKFKAVFGRGVLGYIDDKKYYAGNYEFLKDNNIDINKNIKQFENEGKTVIYVADENKYLGAIFASDVLKDSSKEAVELLKKEGLYTCMLTGDNLAVANKIGKDVGIEKVYAKLLPEDKQNIIKKYQKEGKKVAFIGDGINDSPSLMTADVGVSLGNSTDIAIESSDVILMKGDLLSFNTFLKLSKKVIKNIKENLFWAFIYNILGIPIAAGLLYIPFNIKLNPMLGALFMSFSSVFVVTNALRIKSFRGIDNMKNSDEIKMIVYIDKMYCNHCKQIVEETLKSIEQVKDVKVYLDKKCAVIYASKEIEKNIIKEKLDDKGYTLKEINMI